MSGNPVALLRMTDCSGEQLVCCCAPSGSGATVVFEALEDGSESPARGIVIDSSGPIQITNPKDASALAAWLSAAAVWLQVQQIQDKGGPNGRDDG